MEEAAGRTIESFDIQRLLGMLPHRYPFLLVDRIIEARGDEFGIGIKNVTINEPQFTGPFPGQPGLSWRVADRGMAQTAGALCVPSAARRRQPPLVYLMTIDKAKFRKPVIPGDRVELHMTKFTKRRNIWWFRGGAQGRWRAGRRGRNLARCWCRPIRAVVSESPGGAAVHPPPSSSWRPARRRASRSGPFCHVGPQGRAGRRRQLKSHVVVAGDTRSARAPVSSPSPRIGHEPQDLKYRGERSTFDHRCGLPDPRRRDDESRARPAAAARRWSATAAPFWPIPMSRHDCQLGDDIILSNNVMLAGHCQRRRFRHSAAAARRCINSSASARTLLSAA